MTDDRHKCPAEGCSRLVPFDMLACRAHWFKVSKPTRDWVWRAWRSGSAGEHLAAREQAVSEMNGK